MIIKTCVLIVAKCKCGLERTEEQNFNRIKGGHEIDKVRIYSFIVLSFGP